MNYLTWSPGCESRAWLPCSSSAHIPSSLWNRNKPRDVGKLRPVRREHTEGDAKDSPAEMRTTPLAGSLLFEMAESPTATCPTLVKLLKCWRAVNDADMWLKETVRLFGVTFPAQWREQSAVKRYFIQIPRDSHAVFYLNGELCHLERWGGATEIRWSRTWDPITPNERYSLKNKYALPAGKNIFKDPRTSFLRCWPKRLSRMGCSHRAKNTFMN